jgi:hypothetical protein
MLRKNRLIRINAEVLTRQIGLVGKQTLWASRIACKWRHIFVCVHRRFSLFMPPHQIHIYLRLLEPHLGLFAAAGSWSVEGGGVSLRISANRFICHIDVCLQCKLLPWCIARSPYIFTWFYVNRGGAEREREIEKNTSRADHTARSRDCTQERMDTLCAAERL